MAEGGVCWDVAESCGSRFQPSCQHRVARAALPQAIDLPLAESKASERERDGDDCKNDVTRPHESLGEGPIPYPLSRAMIIAPPFGWFNDAEPQRR